MIYGPRKVWSNCNLHSTIPWKKQRYLIVFSALNLDCKAEFLSVTEQVSISCSSSNGDISTLQFQCSLDGVSVTIGCELLP